jgi:hypothetical protein
VRGEDLQGLNLEELHKLEKLIETSLCRVVEEKVCVVFSCLDSGDMYAENSVQYLTHVSTSICFRGVKL